MFTSEISQQTSKNPQVNHRSSFDAQVGNLIGSAVSYFRQITRRYAVFNMGFFLLGLFEVLGLILFFHFLHTLLL
ncbi:MAG: hypothetical protein LVR00_08835 [Rhabdochlamydiaceae bacterium]